MSILKTIVCLVIIASLIGIPSKAISEPLEIKKEATLEEYVVFYTTLYGGDIELNKRIIQCESQWNINALGDGGRSFGIMQFQKDSFNRISKSFGEELDYYSAQDQIKLGVWAIANGYGREWTAYRAIKNGGTYSFYSRQLKRHFTVHCE